MTARAQAMNILAELPEMYVVKALNFLQKLSKSLGEGTNNVGSLDLSREKKRQAFATLLSVREEIAAAPKSQDEERAAALSEKYAFFDN